MLGQDAGCGNLPHRESFKSAFNFLSFQGRDANKILNLTLNPR